jgi:ABC-type nitrate/sulfonate/bicarbonate transport system substrate-binding protein
MPLDISSIDPYGSYGAQQLWATRCPVPCATAIALQQRWIHAEFETEGIRVATLQETDDAQLRLRPVYHNLRGLFHEGGNIAAFWARAYGFANTAVIGLTWADEYQAILTRPNEDLIGPGSLQGKRLALPTSNDTCLNMWRAMALRAYLTTLELAGYDSDDAQFVDVVSVPTAVDAQQSQSDAWLKASIDALLRRRVDAVYVRGAAAKRLKRMHALGVAFDISASRNLATRISDSTPRLLTIDRDFLAEHPNVVARYLAVLLQTAKWAELHAKESRRILANHLQIDPSILLSGYGRFVHRHLSVQLTPKLVLALIDQKNFLLRHRFIPADFDVTDWINPQPLMEAQRLVANGVVSLPELAAA